MLDTPDRVSFLSLWRDRIRATLPEFASQLAGLGTFGVVAASIAILSNDPTLASFSGFLTGLAGNFIAGAVERLRNAPTDQDRDILLQQIADDISKCRGDSKFKETIQQLELINSMSGLSGKLDGITQILSELVNTGLASQTQVNAQHSQGFLNHPSGPVTQTFVNTTQEAAHYTRDALHQLRPIPGSFTGRTEEIRALNAHIRADLARAPASTHISCIYGMPGIGKTDFANVVAHTLAADFPDGQLFIELGANSPVPLTSDVALATCIRLLARDPKLELPEDLTSLRTLYLNYLHGKRVLILLDDAKDDAHVASLLPQSGCTAIITSRHTLATGMLYELAPLPRLAAVTLLSTYAPRLTPANADSIAQLCGDLPIALTVAGGYLKTRRTIPVSEYIDILRGADRVQLLGVALSFETSYLALTQEERIMLHALSVMPTDFNRDAGLAIGQVSIGRKGRRKPIAADTLDNLVAANLLQYDEISHRFRWHDLLLAYVRTHTSVNESMSAAQRHASFYLKVLHDVERMYMRGDESITRGLSLFDCEWLHIQAGQVWVAEHFTESTLVSRLAEGYTEAGVNCLGLRLHSRVWIKWLDISLAASHRLSDRHAECASLGHLGTAHHSVGEYQSAITNHQLQLALARNIRDHQQEGSALGGLGNVFYSTGNYPKAFDYQEQQHAIACRLGDSIGQGIALGSLANISFAQGDYQQAIDYHEQNLTIRRQLLGWRGEGASHVGLGNAYYALGKYHKSIVHFKEALNISLQLRDQKGEGSAYGGLGNAYHALGNYDKAIEYYDKWLATARLIADRRDEATALGNLGNVYHGKGDYHRAIDYNLQRLTSTREIGDRHGEGQSLGNLGLAYFYLHDLQQANYYGQEYLTIARSIGDRRGEGIALGNLGSVCCALGEYQQALLHHHLQLDISREIGDRQNEGQAQGGLGSVYDSMSDFAEAIDHYQQCLVIARQLGDRREEALVSWNLGNIYGKTGELKQAVAYLQILVDFESAINHSDYIQHAAYVEELRPLITASG